MKNKPNISIQKFGVTRNIIKMLMNESNLKEAELARQTGLPQTTINRLLLGETTDPRANTLIPIAKFFGVSVGQLLGEEAINPSRIPGSFNPINRQSWAIIPIIAWKDALNWSFIKNKYHPSTHHQWVTTFQEAGIESFALYTLDSMQPRFRKKSIIIVDPDYAYKDGNYVIVSINNNDPTVRKIIKDGTDIYFKKMIGNEKCVKKTCSSQILGTIIETRISEK